MIGRLRDIPRSITSCEQLYCWSNVLHYSADSKNCRAITRTLNDTYEPQLYGIGNARTQFPVSAFITDLVYLRNTNVVVDVKKLTVGTE